jgi:hypothetical protein
MGLAGSVHIVAAVTVDANGRIPIAPLQYFDVSAIYRHLKFLHVARTAGLIDGQGHSPPILIGQLHPQRGIGSRITTHFIAMTIEATHLLFIVMGITADGRMASQTFKAGRTVDRLLILTTVNIKRNRFSILKAALEIRICVTHQAVGITPII